MKTNTRPPAPYPRPVTSEGAPAARLRPDQELSRAVAACMLWEDNFYESGLSIADRIKALVPLCTPLFVANSAIEARSVMKLRHVPLLLAREMARNQPHAKLVGKLLPEIIQRADELAEFLSIYWKDDPNQSVSKQVKLGLAAAFPKFSEYELAKYDRPGKVKLRDVLFICHAKPNNVEQSWVWKRLVDGALATPDTWETALSGGADKKETFERLMVEKKLGALAFLRNLRNMKESGVSKGLVSGYSFTVDIARVLPFRFIAAARAVPEWEDIIEPMMLNACEGRAKMEGHTVILIDVSGSMDVALSAKAEMSRLDAACGVAILLREVCESVQFATFSTDSVSVAPRRGFALRDAIVHSQPHGGTMLGAAVTKINLNRYDRLIVLTDEQTADTVPAGNGPRCYLINVASSKNGVGYGHWNHIDGFSEGVINYIQKMEGST